MGTRQGGAHRYPLSMAVICTVLASGGLIAAGYSETSTADAAASLSRSSLTRMANNFDEVAAIGFDPVMAPGYGVKLSFADMLLEARRPTPKPLFDLTDPNASTPHLAQGVYAMRSKLPEISAAEMSQVRREIMAAAYLGLGHSYVWGGTSFDHGWDCSGFVQWAYARAGISLPRTEQWAPMVETNNPQPGDLVAQNPDGPNHWSHIGIYIGNGKMISALNPSVGTILHAPSDVSSSSTYFTLPAFASSDELARAEAAAKATASASAKPGASAKPSASASASATMKETGKATGTPTAKPSAKPTPKPTAKPTVPGTTPPTTKPTTTPGTTAPTTPPATTPGTTTPPSTQPTATPTTAPTTTAPTPTAAPPATTVAPPPPTTPAASAPPTTASPSPSPIPSATPSPTPTATPTPTLTGDADPAAADPTSSAPAQTDAAGTTLESGSDSPAAQPAESPSAP